MSYNRERRYNFEPPSSSSLKNKSRSSVSNQVFSRHGYHTMNAIAENAIAATITNVQKKYSSTEEEYFNTDDDDHASSLQYIPAPDSPVNRQTRKNQDDDDDEEDPLDAFMAGINAEINKSKVPVPTPEKKVNEKVKGFRTDIEEEDDEESYYRYVEENPNAGLPNEDSDNEVEYDEDGNPIYVRSKRIIDPLPPIDHSTISYQEFKKHFYNEHEEISNLDQEKVSNLRKTLGIKVSGSSIPKPVTSFAHFNFDESLMKIIRKSEFTSPTPIQSQGIPAAMSGRDVIGIAKTGSGKTASYIWPMLIHILDQGPLEPGDGPIGLILVPTRELCQQIYVEVKKFAKPYNLQVTCCYGGGNKYEQSKSLSSGMEIVVATPGRIIDLIKMKATNLTRCTFLVLDEADRMLDMGFEPQVRSICNHVRPDRQTLLYSATFKKKIEKLTRDFLKDAIKIVQGDIGEANSDVIQHVELFDNPAGKWEWLIENLVKFTSEGSVLIFVTKKLNAEELYNNLKLREHEVLLLHGDMEQIERNNVINAFKKKDIGILIATDVAARGLDIPHIRTVVNYNIARDIDTHTHRIGRTGRAGEKGTAYTLVTEKDKEFAGHLVRNLEGANQEVPTSLMNLAMQSSWFKKSRLGPKNRSSNIGGRGFGFHQGDTNINKEASHSKSTFSNTSSINKDKSATFGPASNRLSAMKAAFRSQYSSQFKPSSDDTWQQTTAPPSVVMPPPPPPSIGMENEKKQITETTDLQKNKDSSNTRKAKRTRWE